MLCHSARQASGERGCITNGNGPRAPAPAVSCASPTRPTAAVPTTKTCEPAISAAIRPARRNCGARPSDGDRQARPSDGGRRVVEAPSLDQAHVLEGRAAGRQARGSCAGRWRVIRRQRLPEPLRLLVLPMAGVMHEPGVLGCVAVHSVDPV